MTAGVSLAGDGQFAGLGCGLHAVGRDGGAVDVDAARHSPAASVSEVPGDWRGAVHVAASRLCGGPHLVSHQVIDVDGDGDHGVGAVVHDDERGLVAGGR